MTSNSKICIMCYRELPLDSFNKDKSKKDGHQSRCKTCRKTYDREYRKDNKEKIREYRKDNKEKMREYRKKNKEKKREYDREYRNENKKKINEYAREYRKENKEKIKEKKREYYRENKEKKREYERERRKTDPQFRITRSLRARLWESLKAQKAGKARHTLEYVGCSAFELELWLQASAVVNYGNKFNIYRDEYHMDHIIPCSSFDLKQESEICKCFHFSNLQILTPKDNTEKQDNKLDTPWSESLKKIV